MAGNVQPGEMANFPGFGTNSEPRVPPFEQSPAETAGGPESRGEFDLTEI
jgi:hypothetical protein